MLRFLPGILILQSASVALVLILGERLSEHGWAPVAVILGLLGLLTAFWFGSIARHIGKDRLHDAHRAFAQEREQLRVKSERKKRRIVERAQQRAQQEVIRARASASLKVGAAIAGVASAGVLMLFTQFVTVELLVLATASGAAAGYVLRARQETARLRGERHPAERGRLATPTLVDRLPGFVRAPLERLRHVPTEGRDA